MKRASVWGERLRGRTRWESLDSVGQDGHESLRKSREEIGRRYAAERLLLMAGG